MNNYDVIIIGGGPAGMFAAIQAASGNKSVAILEKNKTCGKKLLLAGAGKCNITQDGDISNFFDCYGKNGKFLKQALMTFNNEDLLNFFRKRGLSFMTTEKGKVFPETMKAMDVLQVLVKECEKRGVQIKTNTTVTQVTKQDQSFAVETTSGNYESHVVVIATGGITYQNTGSTGDGYPMAKSFGHKIIPTKPALTPLKIKNYELVDMSGTSFENLSYTLWRNNKKIGNFQGDFLLTHSGISGPGIINNSRDMQSGDVVKCNFVGADSIEEFRNALTKKLNNGGKTLVKSVVRELNLTRRFADKVLELCEIHDDLKCAEINKATRSRLLTTLTEYEMEVKELGGYHLAMVTTGGVSIKEVKPKTMESKVVENLYFIGEVLDVDGDTGGYNIQAAFSMGYVAGVDIAQNKNL
ncbi:MAG TPA: NAD(P)/FAD-dependent oxidoreductase [Firmicutes bacterium]|nr:NAD(P)/FAD-dependent oxidoreductase [Bacillota bacterium]